jgi:hypothetical protein
MTNVIWTTDEGERVFGNPMKRRKWWRNVTIIVNNYVLFFTIWQSREQIIAKFQRLFVAFVNCEEEHFCF